MQPSSARTSTWKWAVCGILLFATMLNYMDRMTLNQTAKRITEEFKISEKEYGYVEGAFGLAFAIGSLLGGLCVDRWNVWWIYPLAVTLWSVAGAVTGLAYDFTSLMACRFLLGLLEAFHWPCALRTTQRILEPEQRSLGNSILQSGAAVGAIVTPLVVLVLVKTTDTWRYPFVVIGAFGITWVVAWFLLVRREDLALPSAVASDAGGKKKESVLALFLDARFRTLCLVVVCINGTWHFFRVWLTFFLQKTHGFDETQFNLFCSAYYFMADIGSLAAGFLTLALIRKGWGTHRSRMLVFGSCACLTALSITVPFLSTGPILLLVLLIIGFGALGLFPNYYSFSQDLTVKHQGKITGTLGFTNWVAMAAMQPLMGLVVARTQSYALGMTVAGILPLVAFSALLAFWREPGREEKTLEVAPSQA